MGDIGNLTHAMTLHDYRKAEAEGKITKPITDVGLRAADRTMRSVPQTPSKGTNDRNWVDLS